MWALVIYSFSITRNFQEIFFRPYKSIKDKKFEVFNGLRFLMMIWIMLGHCYLLGSVYGDTSHYLKQTMLNNFFTQIVISADLPVSFFYFMSSFIGMFALIKKYTKYQNDNSGHDNNWNSNDENRNVD